MLSHLQNKSIAVTGLHSGDNPQPGIGIVRCIQKAGFKGKIIGLVYDILESGIYADNIADSYYRIPFPTANEEELLTRYRYITQKTPIDVLVLTLDSELQTYIKIAPKLLEMGIKMYLPQREQLELREKSKLVQTVAKLGIATPKTEVIFEEQQLLEVAERIAFPAFIKGNFYGASQVFTINEAIKLFREIREHWGLPIILQEVIVGDEYNIALLGDGTGEILGMIPQRKLIVTEKGKGFGGVVIKNDELSDFAVKIVNEIKWRGGCELEIIKANNGSFYLLEINPRFPAWIRLAEGAGQNLPALLVRLALGEKVEELTDYQVGTMFIRHSEDVIASINKMGIISTVGELF